MAFADLSPAAAIWQARGLRYIIDNDSIPKQPVIRDPQADSRAEARAVASQPARPARNLVLPQKKPENEKPAIQKPAATWKPLPPGAWPEIWRQRLAETREGSIAWTYKKLGADLLAGKKRTDSDAAQRSIRSKFLSRIISDLKLPDATHTFWPPALAGQLEPLLFWSGLKELGSRHVIILGPELAEVLTEQELGPWRQISHNGCFVWILPDIDSVSEAEYQRMLTILRYSLGDFPL